MSVQRIERTDLWKHNARVLQLRLRDRFRVAVDRHRHRRADSFFPSTVQRCICRFRQFRRDSLPPSTSFYRRQVSKDLSGEADSVIFRILQAVAVPLLGNVCHVFMNGLNRVQVYGLEKLHDALLNRPKNRSLLTVSNHVAAMDDPLLIASLLPPRVLLDAQHLRWTLCASDRCFGNPATSAFFRSVKVLPVSRGDGIYQKGMDLAISKLNAGGWVHIFPEGSRSRDGGKTMGSSKRGVGRLVLDADSTPVVLPFVHSGMQEIMPIGANFPRVGKTVTVVIGDPIQFDDLLNAEGTKDLSRGKLYDAVAERIGNRLQELKVEVENLAIKHSMQLQNSAGAGAVRAAAILHQVDWDAFGLTGTVPLADDYIEHEAKGQVNVDVTNQVEASSDGYLRMGLAHEDQIASKLHSCMHQTELMGFAARGLFMNRTQEEHHTIQNDINPMRAWRQFLESNLCPQLSFC